MTEEDRPLFEIAPCQQGFTLNERSSGQAMHSQIGPWAEAGAVYIAQSDLETRLKPTDSPLVVYDIGMGTAANVLALVHAYHALGSARPLEIVSFEKHPSALAQALKAPLQFPFLDEFAESSKELLNTGACALSPSIQWKLVTGDFLKVGLSDLRAPELIYFDFYSPASCPGLWSQSVFKKLFRKVSGLPVARNSTLITYAASKSVRSAMLLAGFYVGAGTSTDLKLETTLASNRLESLAKPLDMRWLKSLERAGKPFHPEVALGSYAEIFQRLKAHPQFKV